MYLSQKLVQMKSREKNPNGPVISIQRLRPRGGGAFERTRCRRNKLPASRQLPASEGRFACLIIGLARSLNPEPSSPNPKP